MRFFTDNDIVQPPLRQRRIAVIGFGSQGRAHAMNLRDSRVDVTVGLRPSSGSRSEAEAAGLPVLTIPEAVSRSDVIALLIPDEEQPGVYRNQVRPAMGPGKTLLFAHGFAVHFGLINPPEDADVVMVAPKGPGPQVRSEYAAGRGVVMLAAVHRDTSGAARQTALEYASAIGGGRAVIFESTFKDECETDLFGEQAVICGGLSHLIMAGFETLVEAGCPPEMAYFECLHEVKFTADLIHQHGIDGMRRLISNTAAFGDVTRGPRVIGDGVREQMRLILEEIRSGRFAEEWMEENRSGRRRLRRLLQEGAGHPVEKVGLPLRGKIPSLSTRAKNGNDS